jgi:hypothetical protein
MTDPISLAASPDAAAAAGAGPAAQSRMPLDHGETRVFADLMKAGPAPTLPPASVSGGPNALRDAAMGYMSQLSGGGRSIEELRSAMLASVDPTDPVKTMFAMTNLSMEAQSTFTKLHISTGLASAATNLFGTLLKNQQ